jgi:hypothetical protein
VWIESTIALIKINHETVISWLILQYLLGQATAVDYW